MKRVIICRSNEAKLNATGNFYPKKHSDLPRGTIQFDFVIPSTSKLFSPEKLGRNIIRDLRAFDADDSTKYEFEEIDSLDTRDGHEIMWTGHLSTVYFDDKLNMDELFKVTRNLIKVNIEESGGTYDGMIIQDADGRVIFQN